MADGRTLLWPQSGSVVSAREKTRFCPQQFQRFEGARNNVSVIDPAGICARMTAFSLLKATIARKIIPIL